MFHIKILSQPEPSSMRWSHGHEQAAARLSYASVAHGSITGGSTKNRLGTVHVDLDT